MTGKNATANTLWNLLKILLAIGLIVYVFSITDIKSLFALRGQISINPLILTFVFYILLTLLKALKYHVLMPNGTSYPRVLNIVVLQNAISNFFANSAGIASYMTMLKVEENIKLGKSGLVFILNLIGDLFSVWLVILVCGFIYWSQIKALHSALIFIELLIGLGLLFFAGVLTFRKPFINFFLSILEKLRLTKISLVGQVTQPLNSLADMPREMLLRNVAVTFGLSLLYYLLTLAWMIVSLRAFGFHAKMWQIVIVSSGLQVFSLLPITILGGLGVTEATSLYLYSLLGFQESLLSPVLVGWRILFYLTNLFALLYLPLYTLFFANKNTQK